MKGSHYTLNIFPRILSCIIIHVNYITVYAISRMFMDADSKIKPEKCSCEFT